MKMRVLIVFVLLSLSSGVILARGRGKALGKFGAKPGKAHGGFGVKPKPPTTFGLIPNFYKITRTCPEVEQLVRQITWEKTRIDRTLGAKLLRVHYHDCFVKGCDASILLDTVGTNQSEKDARPNQSLAGFEVIDEIKTQVEKICPRTVSCADILALAARDAVSFQFKKSMWDVLTGRKDGMVSLLSDVTGNLPSASSNFSTLHELFSNKGLDINDLVALSGAHTIGESHCGAFSRRLNNFTGKGDTDPSLDRDYAAFLKSRCPTPANPATTVSMDPNSTFTFDSHYFTAVNQKKGLFQSDAALLTDPTAAAIVRQFESPAAFFAQFAKSMVKMGGMQVLVGDAGEIRNNCRVIN